MQSFYMEKLKMKANNNKKERNTTNLEFGVFFMLKQMNKQLNKILP